MKRHEVKISIEDKFIWVACEVIGYDEDRLIVQYRDLNGILYEENFPEHLIRAVNVEIPDDILIEAATLAANYIRDYLIFANSQDIEDIAYSVFDILERQINIKH